MRAVWHHRELKPACSRLLLILRYRRGGRGRSLLRCLGKHSFPSSAFGRTAALIATALFECNTAVTAARAVAVARDALGGKPRGFRRSAGEQCRVRSDAAMNTAADTARSLHAKARAVQPVPSDRTALFPADATHCCTSIPCARMTAQAGRTSPSVTGTDWSLPQALCRGQHSARLQYNSSTHCTATVA